MKKRLNLVFLSLFATLSLNCLDEEGFINAMMTNYNKGNIGKNFVLQAYLGASEEVRNDEFVQGDIKEINDDKLPTGGAAVDLPAGKDNKEKFKNLFNKDAKNNYGYKAANKLGLNVSIS